MNKTLVKQILTYLGIAALFLVLAYGFVPQVLSGKIVNQSDISSWSGMTHEVTEHNKANPDDKTLWTNSLFGGMPVAAMYDDFDGDWTKPIYKALLAGRRPATYLFIALLGAFLLMLSLGIDKIIACAGAVAVAFCSYNMQIIQVGHNTKMQAIAFFPWVLAALIFTYKTALGGGAADRGGHFRSDASAERGRECSAVGGAADRGGHFRSDASAERGRMFSALRGPQARRCTGTILGSVLFALALSMQIKANHPQITWYLAVVILIYAIGLLIYLCAKKDRRSLLKPFFIASALLLVTGCTGIATNANKLIPTWQFSKQTMRGGSELTAENEGEESKGLDIEYATAWSYGIEETPNLLIPNFNGGSSAGELALDSETGKLLKKAGYGGRELRETLKYMPLYWGPQPFTAGPMYLGAISIFLFVLGLFLCEGKDKWWIVAATVVAVFLSWGNHFLWFTKLFYNYVPMYSKFRTVSMALTVLQVTVPVLAFVCLDKVLKGGFDKKETLKYGAIAWAITGGFCLLCWLFPGIAGGFSADSDASQPEVLQIALAKDRAALLSRDALRSLGLITAAFALVFWAVRAKNDSRTDRKVIAAVCIGILVLVDLFSAGRRYLNADHFITKKEFSGQFTKRPVDEYILEDTDPDYRVLDLSVNTFNDAHQCYWHKCIGGYSPAKLQRYQDLIDHYIADEASAVIKTANKEKTIQGTEDNFPETPILNALNCRYVVLQADLPPVVNPGALGNCWFVRNAVKASSANEEISLVGSTDLSQTAVLTCDYTVPEAVEDGPFKSGFLNESLDYIELESYAANELHYRFCTRGEKLAVFSEIYYPNGWTATINGEEVDIMRADWILRALPVPEGEGEIVFRFDPQSYRTGEAISRASSIVLLLMLILAAVPGAVSSLRRKEDGR